MEARLTRDERLTRQGDIDACYRAGRRLRGPMLRVHLLANDLERSRIAISVPTRLCNAVKRNRWKRLVREAFRLNKAEIGTGLDIVVVPNRPPEGLKRQDVEAALIALLKKARP